MTKTLSILMAQYNGAAVAPLKRVAKDYFNLSVTVFIRKINKGDIVLPVVIMEGSQKSARGVHISDLANYIDRRRKYALRDLDNLDFKERDGE